MPTIANPPSASVHDLTSDELNRIDPALPRSVVLRIRVAVKRGALIRELAEGADRTASPELALLAARLSGDRSRKRLARTLRRTLAEAHEPSMSRSRVVIIRRGAVLDAADALRAMIERLTSSEPVRAEGIAIAERILTSADWSPLYNRAEPGSLRRLVLVATAAMEPGPATTGALSIAA
jgi:hypothetical protein